MSRIQRIFEAWRPAPKALARTLIAKYGLPEEATSMRLVWRNSGAWTTTELMNEEVRHDFPTPHVDMLFQSINYQVPVGRLDDLGRFNGSVVVDRTRGLLGARGGSEEENFAAVNLAREILTGVKNVADARRFEAEAMQTDAHPRYLRGLLFNVPKLGQGYPDMPLVVRPTQPSLPPSGLPAAPGAAGQPPQQPK